MIQPVNALAPKVYFKGQNNDPAKNEEKKTKRNIALINAIGISTVAGAFTSVIARSYTATWKNAGLYGMGAGLLTMMFICPKLLYKAGLYTSKAEKETELTSRKILDINTNKLGNYSKNTLKKLR